MELNFIVLLGNNLVEYAKTLNSEFNIPGPTPFNISGNLNLLAPANNILLEYLKDVDPEYEEEDTITDLL